MHGSMGYKQIGMSLDIHGFHYGSSGVHVYLLGFKVGLMMLQNWHSRIRQSYEMQMPEIMKAGERDRIGRIDPNWLPWHEMFSPIEADTWNMIRSLGVTLYPQVPVLGYFLDFANPYIRVALEVDGREWHQDVERDRIRDTNIGGLGWHVYRCTGSEVKRYREDPFLTDFRGEFPTHDSACEFYLDTAEGVLSAIAHLYGIWRAESNPYIDLCTETLSKHRLISFPIGRAM